MKEKDFELPAEIKKWLKKERPIAISCDEEGEVKVKLGKRWVSLDILERAQIIAKALEEEED